LWIVQTILRLLVWALFLVAKALGLFVLQTFKLAWHYCTSRSSTLSLSLFHGTTVESAKSILQNGFRASSQGQLGAGLYLAREDKAQKFATDGRHGWGRGVVFCVDAVLRNPLFKSISSNVGNWQAQGHDGVRVDRTLASHNMEWCVLPKWASISRWRYSDEQGRWRSPSERPN
jgi:hypothetical protein